MTGIPAYDHADHDRHPPPQAVRRHRPAPGAAHPGPGCRARRPAAVRARSDARVRRRPAGGARGAVPPAEDGAGRTALSGERARVTRPTPQGGGRIAGRQRAPSAGGAGRRPAFPGGAHRSSRWAWRAMRPSTRPSDDLRELRDALEANRQSLGDLAKFERTDVAFHYVLAVIPRNPIFTAIHAAIAEWLVEQRHVTLTYPGARTRSPTSAHAADLRGDRGARSRPRRARDARPSGPGRRALLASEGGRANERLRHHGRFPAEAGNVTSAFRRLIDDNARASLPRRAGLPALRCHGARRAMPTASCCTRSTTTARPSTRTSRPAHFARFDDDERAAGRGQEGDGTAIWFARDRRPEDRRSSIRNHGEDIDGCSGLEGDGADQDAEARAFHRRIRDARHRPYHEDRPAATSCCSTWSIPASASRR